MKTTTDGHGRQGGGAVYRFSLIFALLSLGIIAGGAVYFRQYEKHYRAQVENQLSAIAELKVAELADWREERMRDGTLFHKNKNFTARVRRAFEAPDDTDAQEWLSTWPRQIRTIFQYARVSLLDTQGVERMAFPPTPMPVCSQLLRQAPEIMRAGRIVFLDLHRDAPDHPIHLTVVVPILDEMDAGRPLGALVLRIDPATYLYPFIKRWPTPSRTAETLLIRRDGNDALFLNELRFQTNTALNLRSSLANVGMPAVKAALGQEGIVEGVDYRGVPVIADVRHVPDSPWFLVSRIDTEEVCAPLRRGKRIIILAIVILLFSAGASVSLVWQQSAKAQYKALFESEKSRHETEDRYRKLFEGSADGILIADLELKGIQHANPTVCRMLGYTAEELRTMTMADLHPKEDLQRVMAEFEAQARGDKTLAAGLPCLRKDGTIVYMDVSAIAMSIDGKACNVGFFRDITERKQAEENNRRLLEQSDKGRMALLGILEDHKRAEEEIRKLNESLERRVNERTQELLATNRELEAFSYSVSHDLRAPLRAIDGFTRILQEEQGAALSTEAQRYCGLIRANAKQMDLLVNDLLALAKYGRYPLTKGKTQPDEIIRHLIDDLRPEWGERKLDIRMGTLPPCQADPILLKQVLFNLLINAIKFTRAMETAFVEIGSMTGREFMGQEAEQPHTSLDLSRLAPETSLYVIRDNGVGFDMRYSDKLFGMFQRLHRAEEYEGTGVGLAIVQRIIHRHGGQIWAKAEVNNGATFYFYV